MKLNKKDVDAEFWPRLLADKNLEKTNVKIDWDRYVDEDEADGKDFDLGNLDIIQSFPSSFLVTVYASQSMQSILLCV